MAHQKTSDAQEGAFNTEHMLAYAFAAVALILGVIGLLRGFGILGNDGTADAGAAGTQDISFPAIWDSVVWLLPAITAALLAWALHRNEHHRFRDPEHVTDTDEAGWKGEHLGAYAFALVAVVTAGLGMLTGFNVWGRDFGDQPDAIPWLLASLGAATLTNALHSVGHHQLSRERDVVVAARRADAPPITRTDVGTGSPR